MSRRRRPKRREVMPDPKYHNKMIARFINNIMKDGKKSTAEKIFYTSLDIIGERTGKQGIDSLRRR